MPPDLGYVPARTERDGVLANTLTDAATVTSSGLTADLQCLVTTQNFTLAAPSGTAANGQVINYRFMSATTDFTITFNAAFRATVDIALPATVSGSGKYDYISFIRNSTSAKWDVYRKNFGA